MTETLLTEKDVLSGLPRVVKANDPAYFNSIIEILKRVEEQLAVAKKPKEKQVLKMHLKVIYKLMVDFLLLK